MCVTTQCAHRAATYLTGQLLSYTSNKSFTCHRFHQKEISCKQEVLRYPPHASSRREFLETSSLLTTSGTFCRYCKLLPKIFTSHKQRTLPLCPAGSVSLSQDRQTCLPLLTVVCVLHHFCFFLLLWPLYHFFHITQVSEDLCLSR